MGAGKRGAMEQGFDKEAFANDDARLRERAAQFVAERSLNGLRGLVGGLRACLFCVEPHNLRLAVEELLGSTGYEFRLAYESEGLISCVLTQEGSPDFLVRCRKRPGNPFLPGNLAPRTARLPNTRLETFVFACQDIDALVRIQSGRGVRFMTPGPLRRTGFEYIQTAPSAFTGNSVGFIRWKGPQGEYLYDGAREVPMVFVKPPRPYLSDVGLLDHTATRVKAEHRDDAILEFMGLTEYDFDFAIHVETLNSITSVARKEGEDYAQVFTSGITPFTDMGGSGPTERFIRNFGPRVHHMAFRTQSLDAVFAGLSRDGMRFLADPVGSPCEGLRQVFTEAAASTFLVTEYIQRFGGFDGFFTKSNVTELTRATDRQ